MVGQWRISLLRKHIPELQSEPVRIWFHITGELLTALALAVSGTTLLTGSHRGPVLFLLSIGMLNTLIVSPGCLARRRQWGWVLMFGALFILSIASVILLLRHWPACLSLNPGSHQ